jgi:hypothetical protein
MKYILGLILKLLGYTPTLIEVKRGDFLLMSVSQGTPSKDVETISKWITEHSPGLPVFFHRGEIDVKIIRPHTAKAIE